MSCCCQGDSVSQQSDTTVKTLFLQTSHQAGGGGGGKGVKTPKGTFLKKNGAAPKHRHGVKKLRNRRRFHVSLWSLGSDTHSRMARFIPSHASGDVHGRCIHLFVWNFAAGLGAGLGRWLGWWLCWRPNGGVLVAVWVVGGLGRLLGLLLGWWPCIVAWLMAALVAGGWWRVGDVALHSIL